MGLEKTPVIRCMRQYVVQLASIEKAAGQTIALRFQLARLMSFDQFPFFIELIIFREQRRHLDSYRRLLAKSSDLFFYAIESVTRGNVSRVIDHLRFYIDTHV